MKFSVITVAYNSAATIGHTLQSVSEQVHRDLEHIVVDGASSDGTQEIVRLCGQRVARLISEKDDGIYDAMNKGLALANGEYVGFLNADDVYVDDQTIGCVARAAEDGAPDVVFGDVIYVDAEEGRRVVRRWRSGKFDASRLRFGWMAPHPALFVRTKLLREVGGFDTEFKIAADYDCMLRLFKYRNVRAVYLERVLVKMRVGGVSNRSFRNICKKSGEDLRAIHRNHVGGLFTLVCKNFRKIGQLL